ncbi:MAG: hybrid sensor histidine kinase/response regulator [Planctomycetes bacterium]|nr:hybrid sensor histidine kinase/response regulator [Planctomycetota bacterium]
MEKLRTEAREANDQQHGEQVTRALGAAVARSAELVVDLEERTAELDRANRELAAANVRGAELVAELQCRREELEWANASLRHADESNKRLLSAAAHDLRGGLGRILGFAECVGAGDTSMVGRLEQEAGRLVELLERLLGDSRDESDHIVLRPQAVLLEQLIADVATSHGPDAARKDQRLVVSSAPDEIRLDADPVRLRQAIDNLVSNAIKFSPPGSRIEVIALETRGDVEISVIDEGPGLTEDDLARVFGEFQRLSARPTGGEASHGVGLSIVRSIAEAHGGTARAKNRGDRKGARFSILLPSPVRPGDVRRVLVVDDERSNRRLLVAQLERAGHTTEECADGAEAVCRVLSGAPGWFDLVLMDLEMPGMDGLGAATRIREGGHDADRLPIVAVTGHTDRAHVVAVLDSGMNDLLAKPVRAAGVRCLLRRWCRTQPVR